MNPYGTFPMNDHTYDIANSLKATGMNVRNSNELDTYRRRLKDISEISMLRCPIYWTDAACTCGGMGQPEKGR